MSPDIGSRPFGHGSAGTPQGFSQAVKTICICPDCTGVLEVEKQGLVCSGCGRQYALENRMAKLFPRTGTAQDTVHHLSGMYDRAVAKYRGSPRSCGYATDSAFRHRLNILNHWVDVNTLKDQRILDIGCGTGLMTQDLVRHNEVWGVDVSAGLLARASEKGIFTVQASALSLPFRENRFDLVVCMGVVPYYVNPEKIFFHIARVVRPGGRAVVTSTTGSWLIRGVRQLKNLTWKKSSLRRLYGPAELKAYMSAQGLDVAGTCLGFQDRIMPGDLSPMPLKFRALARVAAAYGMKPESSRFSGPESGGRASGGNHSGRDKPDD